MRATPSLLALPLLLASALPAAAMTDAELSAVLRQRLDGDRSGACVAAAVITDGRVARARECANPADNPRIAGGSFEIGSISKTMTAALLAQLIAEGKGSLDDRLADWLPAGSVVPDWNGEPVRLRHVVTHTSGLPALPPALPSTDPEDPYAGLDGTAVLASLANTRLEAAPGSRYSYSNYAMMLLTLAVAQRGGQDFGTLLRTRLFAPLGMHGAHLDAPPKGGHALQGHSSNGDPVKSWQIADEIAGMGAVRAGLDDMVAYARAQLRHPEPRLHAALQATQQPVSSQPPVAMNWLLAPLDGRYLRMHAGATGGFTSYMALDPERQRAVVLLADTSLVAVDGLTDLGQHLVDARLPLGKPRRAAQAPQALLHKLAGDYLFAGQAARLQVRDGKLVLGMEGESDTVFDYDSAGDFHPRRIDARLQPVAMDDGRYRLVWHQMGGKIALLPAGADITVDGEDDDNDAAAEANAAASALDDYAGHYPLQPEFVLSIRVRDGRLQAQATGQGAFLLEADGRDQFAAPAYGLRIEFHRDGDGRVAGLSVHQGGRITRARRT